MFRIASFQRVRPFGLRGKERPIPAPVSPAPSKIPYGEFSPVRLQTSIHLQPSSTERGLICRLPLSQTATRFECPVTWTFVPYEHAGCRQKSRSSSGPWLRSRFCCPAASSLTMATSESLRSRDVLFIFVHRVQETAPKPQSFPNLLCLSFGTCRLPYPGGSDDFIRLFIHRRCCFHPMRRDSTTALPGQSGPA